MPQEQYLHANNIRLCYDEFGDKNNPAVVLIMGLGTQMISWPVPFCEALAAEGFRVIRFDNRDIGLSEKMESLPMPNIPWSVFLSKLGLPVKAPYSLDDMAADTVALMDRLDLYKAHIVGASMGGMIAQLVAANHGDRVSSLTSIMSSSGRRGLPGASKEIIAEMRKRAFRKGKPPVEESVRFWRMIGSTKYKDSDEVLAQKVIASNERSYYPEGYTRQLLAIMANGSRVEKLKLIDAPSLIIHGRDDPLVPLECGIDTARHIPNSHLEVIDGMAHDFPSALVPIMVELISEHLRHARVSEDMSFE